MRKRGSGGLTIATGNCHDPAVTFEPVSEFHFTDKVNPFLTDFFYQFIFFRDPRALHYFISLQYTGLGMFSFFKPDPGFAELVTIIFFQRTSVGHKYIIPFLFCQQRSADSALAPTQYDKSFT